jgi:hypothetical protein
MYQGNTGDMVWELHQTVRERLSAPKILAKYTFAEGEDIHYYQSSSSFKE